MKQRSTLATAAQEFLVAAEEHQRKGNERLAQQYLQYAEVMIDKYDLPRSPLTLHRFLSLLNALERLQDGQPQKADEWRQSLNGTILYLREQVEEALQAQGAENGGARGIEELTAKDLYSSGRVRTVREDDSIEKAVSYIAIHQISQLPVVNSGGGVTGLLTEESLVKSLKTNGNGSHAQEKVIDILPEGSAQRLGWVRPDASFADVLRQFRDGVEAVLVVDPITGDLGIITAYDCLSEFAFFQGANGERAAPETSEPA